MKSYFAHLNRKLTSLLLVCVLSSPGFLQAQQIFQPLPLEQRPHLRATSTAEKIKIDGLANEAAWAGVPVATHFTSAYPKQGAKASYDTEVKVLYDDKYIYISARCDFPPGKKSMQVQDLRRDFFYSANELFEVLIDPFKDPRLPVMTFCVTPYGNQMDLLNYADGGYDYKWDGLWTAASTIQGNHWTTEIAIPFSTLRYPINTTEWSINFGRNIRHLGEINGWCAWPQALNESRLQYGGILSNIVAPASKLNLKFEPYTLVSTNASNLSNVRYKPAIGGEVKYAINPNTVLEATINTDFAQADIDRQVINLSRSSVYFPERRQFFLENSSLFSVGKNEIIQPFFSRRIGLSDNGSPLTIDGGLRLVHQDARQSFGLLAMKQEGDTSENGALFGVLRYKRNLSKTLQMGGLAVLRQNLAGLQQPSSFNPVAVLDAFYQTSPSFFIRGMASYSNNSLTKRSGNAAFAEFNYSSASLYFDWLQTAVSKSYEAQTGFVSRADFVNTQPNLSFYIHQNWFPSKLTFFAPVLTADIYHQASTGNFQEATVIATPVHFIFSDLSQISFSVSPSWQNLTEVFQPVRNVDIAARNYQFNRYELYALSNTGARYSAELRLSTGGYYNGSLNSYFISLRSAPIPNVAFAIGYTRNDFKKIGTAQLNVTTHLVAPELRLAANPNVQLSAFYQYNSDLRNGSLNARFSWQYRPLSYIYLVANSINNFYTTPFNVPKRQSGGILKVTYIYKL